VTLGNYRHAVAIRLTQDRHHLLERERTGPEEGGDENDAAEREC
jgi:hypothetical protein